MFSELEKYKLVFEKSPIGIFFYNKQGNIIDLNNAFVQMFCSSREELVNLNIFELANKEFSKQARLAITTGQGSYNDWYEINSSASKLYLKVQFWGLNKNNEEYDYAIAMVENNTQLYENTHQKEVLLDIINNSMILLFIINSRTFEIIEANNQAVKTLGYAKSDLLKFKITDFIFEPDIENFFTLFENKQQNTVVNFKNANQTLIEAFIQKHTLDFVNNIEALYVINISHNHYQNIKIKELEQFKTLLIENLPIALTLKDTNRRWLLANQNALQLFGLENIDFYQKNNLQLAQFCYPYLKEFLQSCEITDIKTIETGQKITYIKKIKNNDDTNIELEVTKVPILDKNNSVCKLLVIINDVTQKNAILNELVEAKTQIEAISRNKTHYIATFTHDIKNQINAIIGIIEILKEENFPEEYDTLLSAIGQSAQTINQVINDLLDYAKMEGNEFSLNIEQVNLIDLFREIFNTCVHYAQQKNNTILLDFQPIIPNIVYTDPLRLTQILTNLLNNSIKFTENGVVELLVDFKPIDHVLGLYIFTVKDTGIGIPEDKQKDIFKPFVHTDKFSDKKYRGSGLGLAICKKIVEKMGGNIWLKSELNKGTIVYFEIPLRYSPANFTFGLKNYKIAIYSNDQYTFRNLSSYLRSFSLKFQVFDEYSQILRFSKDFDILIIDGLNVDNQILDFVQKNKKQAILLSNKTIKMKTTFIQTIKKPFDYFILSEALNNAYNNLQEVQNKKEIVHKDIKKILVVEDNSLNLTLTKMLLNKILPHVSIIDASNGKEAVELMDNQDFDLVFMDIQMPVLDGIAATKQIRNKEKFTNKHTPIIALTAFVVPEESGKCYDAGMDAFLSKPIDIDKLKAIVSRFI